MPIRLVPLERTGSVTEVNPFKGANRIGVSHPKHEDGNISSFRNVVFPRYLEY